MSGIVWLLSASLAATVLAGAVLLLRRPVRRLGPDAALSLWLAPGLALVMPQTGLGLVRWAPPEAAPPPVVTVAPAPPPLPGAPDVPPVPLLAEPSMFLPGWSTLLLGVWLLGALTAGGLAVLRTRRWRRTLLAEAVPVPPALAEAADRVFAAAGVRPRFVVSRAAAAPQVTGLRRPLVAVPPGFERMPPETVSLALRHEAEHVRRGDLCRLALAEAAMAVHWFNPVLRLAAPVLRADIEAACDAGVLRTGARPAAYAEALLGAARGRAAPLTPALTLTHGLDGRIDAMRNPVSDTTRLLGTTACVALAGLAAAVAQVQDEREVVIERSLSTVEDGERAYRFERSDDGTTVRTQWGEGGRSFVTGGEDADMILLGDYFESLVPPAPKPPAADAEPPVPPTPPAAREGGRRLTLKSVVADEGVSAVRIFQGGEWIDDLELQADEVAITKLPDGGRLIRLTDPSLETLRRINEAAPASDGGDLARTMQNLENVTEIRIATVEREAARLNDEMDAFGQEMGAFGEEMGRFGADMGAWGERMGAVGAAVGEVARACDAHKARSDAPTVLSATVAGTDDAVRAVCATGGGARYRSGELSRFVRRNAELSRAEKRAFFDGREAASTVSVSE